MKKILLLVPIFFMILLGFVVIIPNSLAQEYDSPIKQFKDGKGFTDIKCNDGLLLVVRSDGFPACVTYNSATSAGWMIYDKTETSNDVKYHPQQNYFEKQDENISTKTNLSQSLSASSDQSIQAMSIDSQGNVGIGTTNPNARLTVMGSDSTQSGKDAAISIKNTAASDGNSWYMRAGASGTVTPDGGFSIADDHAYRFSI